MASTKQQKSCLIKAEKMVLAAVSIALSQGNLNSALDFLFSKVYLLSFLVYGLWVCLGTAFYTYYNGWTPATGYFYAMEAGLNVGYCDPEESRMGSKIFTMFYVLCGSSLVAGCLGLFISHIVYSNSLLVPEERVKSIFDASDQITLRSIFRFVISNVKHYSGYSHYPSLVKTGVVFFVWVCWGTNYARYNEDWSILNSIYWSVTSLSTGGLQSPTCVTGEGKCYIIYHDCLKIYIYVLY